MTVIAKMACSSQFPEEEGTPYHARPLGEGPGAGRRQREQEENVDESLCCPSSGRMVRQVHSLRFWGGGADVSYPTPALGRLGGEGLLNKGGVDGLVCTRKMHPRQVLYCVSRNWLTWEGQFLQAKKAPDVKISEEKDTFNAIRKSVGADPHKACIVSEPWGMSSRRKWHFSDRRMEMTQEPMARETWEEENLDKYQFRIVKVFL